MNNKISMYKIILGLIGFGLFLTTEAYSQRAVSAGSLTFNISGFADNSGQVIVQLFRKEDKMPKNPFMQIEAKIVDKKAVVVIKDLSYGFYGAIIVHDQNSNGIIDHRWGIPNEPLGYTNNWQLSLLSGMPTFEKLKFYFSESNTICAVQMHK